MKTRILICLFILFLTIPCFSQYAYRIVPVSTLPATCNPANGDVRYLTATATAGIYKCGPAINTWTAIGSIGPGNSIVINQGTLTTSIPPLAISATWNNAANSFNGIFMNMTDTASAVTSSFQDFWINGVSRFSFTKNGRIIISQPSLTTSIPFIDHTATWNNAGTTFINFSSNVTNTASAAGSLLARWQVGGADVFTLRVDGGSTAPFFRADATGNFQFNTRSLISSSANGVLLLTNNTGASFDRLQFGVASTAWPSIAPVSTGGAAQGIIILRGDGSPQTQANLGAAANGTMIYCSDCTIASPCAGGGTGAIAKRLNGAWVCN
jgi:hypothetical protein